MFGSDYNSILILQYMYLTVFNKILFLLLLRRSERLSKQSVNCCHLVRIFTLLEAPGVGNLTSWKTDRAWK